MLTRKKSSAVALVRVARYQLKLRVRVEEAGSVIEGEMIEVVPPSTSLTPAEAPARRAVTRSLVPLTVVPFCRATPPLVVASGSPRSHSPVVAVLTWPVRVQPRSVSKLSKNTSPPPVGVTVRLMLAERVLPPLVPLTCRAEVPVVAVAVAVKVTVLLAVPLGGGVTEDGLGVQVTPVGMAPQARVTALLKPLSEVTVQVVVLLPPWATETLDGLQATEKSGVAVALGVTVTQLL